MSHTAKRVFKQHFTVTAEWSKLGSVLTSSNRITVPENRMTVQVNPLVYSSTLVFSSLDRTKGDEAQYTCSATVSPTQPPFFTEVMAMATTSILVEGMRVLL